MRKPYSRLHPRWCHRYSRKRLLRKQKPNENNPARKPWIHRQQGFQPKRLSRNIHTRKRSLHRTKRLWELQKSYRRSYDRWRTTHWQMGVFRLWKAYCTQPQKFLRIQILPQAVLRQNKLGRGCRCYRFYGWRNRNHRFPLYSLS